MRVLFIGGSGVISSACSWLAVERDIGLVVLNRGSTLLRPLPEQATVLRAGSGLGASLLGDLSHSLVFDNSKLRAVVPDYRPSIPFEQGAREMVAWHDEEPSRQRVDARIDTAMDKLADAYRP